MGGRGGSESSSCGVVLGWEVGAVRVDEDADVDVEGGAGVGGLVW